MNGITVPPRLPVPRQFPKTYVEFVRLSSVYELITIQAYLHCCASCYLSDGHFDTVYTNVHRRMGRRCAGHDTEGEMFTDSHAPLTSPPSSALVDCCLIGNDASHVWECVPSTAPFPCEKNKVQLNSHVLYNVLSQKKRDKRERKCAAEKCGGGRFFFRKTFSE